MLFRSALGADPSGVRRLILGEGLRFASIGLLTGVPLALLTARAASQRLTAVEGPDALLLGLAAAVLLMTTTAACWLPARRASRVSPSEPLRSE